MRARDAVLLTACWLTAGPGPNAQSDFSGTWVLDAADSDRTYGEVRVVRQTSSNLHVTMIDYGTAWVDGAFQDVVRVMPWTFPYDEWQPRRGGPHSRQPRARAQLTRDGVVLEKSTDRGNGDFTWSWTIDPNTDVLRQVERGHSAGDALHFVRVAAADGSRLLNGLEHRAGIVVRRQDTGHLTITCPSHDCRVVEFQSGRQTGVRALVRGAAATVSIDAEVRVERR